RARGGEAEAVDDVVEALLEELQERLAGRHVAAAGGLRDQTAELLLTHAVGDLQLLRFAQLHGVDGNLVATAHAVLARRDGPAALEGGLARQATLTLEPEVDAFAALELFDWSGVPTHDVLLP